MTISHKNWNEIWGNAKRGKKRAAEKKIHKISFYKKKENHTQKRVRQSVKVFPRPDQPVDTCTESEIMQNNVKIFILIHLLSYSSLPKMQPFTISNALLKRSRETCPFCPQLSFVMRNSDNFVIVQLKPQCF